jgi:O-antigen/teichoic acid export membrane protein
LSFRGGRRPNTSRDPQIPSAIEVPEPHALRPARDTPYRSFIRDNAVVIGGHVLVYLKGIVLMPIIIKSVGVTTYGGFVLLTSILGIAFGLSSLGTGVTAKRFLPSAADMTARRELFYPQLSFNVVTVAVISLVFVLLGPPLSTYVFKHEISFAAWVPPLYLFSLFAYSQGVDYFRYTSRLHYMILVSLVFPYFDIAFILIYLQVHGTISIDVLVVSTSVAALVAATAPFLAIVSELGVRMSTYTPRALLADVKLGAPLVLNNILDFILAASDRYLIALYLSVTDVGYYVPGYVLGSLILFVPKAFGTAFPQLLARAVDHGNDSEARRMFEYTIKIFLLVAIPFVFGCLALGRPVLTLLANDQVAARGMVVAPIVALGTLFYGLSLLLSNVLFVRLKTHTIFHINVVAALSNLAANIVLLYAFRSIFVAAVTTLLSYLGAFVYAHVVVGREWPVEYGIRSVVKSIAASIIMAAVVFVVAARLAHDGAIAVLALCALGMTVYVGCLLAFKTFSEKELLFLRRLVA